MHCMLVLLLMCVLFGLCVAFCCVCFVGGFSCVLFCCVCYLFMFVRCSMCVDDVCVAFVSFCVCDVFHDVVVVVLFLFFRCRSLCVRLCFIVEGCFMCVCVLSLC